MPPPVNEQELKRRLEAAAGTTPGGSAAGEHFLKGVGRFLWEGFTENPYGPVQGLAGAGRMVGPTLGSAATGSALNYEPWEAAQIDPSAKRGMREALARQEWKANTPLTSKRVVDRLGYGGSPAAAAGYRQPVYSTSGPFASLNPSVAARLQGVDPRTASGTGGGLMDDIQSYADVLNKVAPGTQGVPTLNPDIQMAAREKALTDALEAQVNAVRAMANQNPYASSPELALAEQAQRDRLAAAGEREPYKERPLSVWQRLGIGMSRQGSPHTALAGERAEQGIRDRWRNDYQRELDAENRAIALGQADLGILNTADQRGLRDWEARRNQLKDKLGVREAETGLAQVRHDLDAGKEYQTPGGIPIDRSTATQMEADDRNQRAAIERAVFEGAIGLASDDRNFERKKSLAELEALGKAGGKAPTITEKLKSVSIYEGALEDELTNMTLRRFGASYDPVSGELTLPGGQTVMPETIPQSLKEKIDFLQANIPAGIWKKIEQSARESAIRSAKSQATALFAGNDFEVKRAHALIDARSGRSSLD